MSIESIPVVQMGHVEKVAENLETQPVVQQQATQTEAERILREQNSKVPPPESAEKTRGRRVGERGEESGGKNRDGRQPPPRRNDADEEQPAQNPWSGNILNVKV